MSCSMTKPIKWPLRPAAAGQNQQNHLCAQQRQISLGIRPVWSEYSLSTWRNIGSSATHWAQAKTLIRLGGCPGWSESSLGTQIILLVLSWGSSNSGYDRWWAFNMFPPFDQGQTADQFCPSTYRRLNAIVFYVHFWQKWVLYTVGISIKCSISKAA